MTAVNVILKSDAAFIVSDGALVDTTTGKVLGFGSKVILLPQIPAAVIMRGPLLLVPALALVLFKFAPATFDELRKRITKDLRTEFEPYIRRIPYSRDLDVAVAAWSENEGGPCSFFITSSNIHPIAPWEPLDPGVCFILPETETMLAGRLADRRKIDPMRDGLDILQAQRQLAAPLNSKKRGWWPVKRSTADTGAGLHIVGGFAQVTEIRRSTITTHIIGRWDDKIGEVIQPDLEPVQVLRRIVG